MFKMSGRTFSNHSYAFSGSMLRRLKFKSFAATAIILFSWICCAAAAGDHRLNVVIISFDLLRTDRLASYGGSKNLAPNIDALHRRSVVFLNAISPSSYTLAAAMSVFTGLYPFQHKITNTRQTNEQGRMEAHRLAPDLITLPEVFKSRGYETGFFLGGWDIWHNFGLERGVDFFSGGSEKLVDSLARAELWVNKRSDPRPFFLLIQGFDLYNWQKVPEQKLNPAQSGLFPATPERTDMVAVYDERITAVDHAFGKFVAFLEKNGFLKNTVIVFLSHHGEGLGIDSHGPPMHSLGLYDEFIHVPLMIYRPGTLPAAERAQVNLLDLGPTLIAAAGLAEDDKFAAQTGRTALYPFAAKKNECRSVFSEIEPMYITELASVRTCSGWKLIYDFQNSARQLFDLNKDPGETENLFKKEPETAGRLEKELFDRLSE